MRQETGDQRPQPGKLVRPHRASPGLWSPVSGLRSAAGFTLVELIVICVVLAILLAVSAPRLQPAIQRLRTEQAAFDLVQWLRMASERAVAESRAFVWRWDEEARRVRLELGTVEAEAIDGGPPPGGGLLPAEGHPVAADVAVEVLREGEAVACRCVRFFPDGTSESATITVDSPSARYAITVDATTGHVALERVAAGPAAG